MMLQAPVPAVRIHSPNEIVSIVDGLEKDRSQRHARMDGDMDMYHLKPYAGELDEDGEDTLAGYKKFTSNDPATVMNLALHLGSTAKRIVKVHQPRAQKPQREVDNAKELFCLGSLSVIDERRQQLGMPELQDAMFSQSLFRGGICQRVLLVKEQKTPEAFAQETAEWKQKVLQIVAQQTGEPLPEPPSPTRTYEDVTDWDPRNTYWAYGKHGLAWACEKSYKSRQQILEEYDVDPAEDKLAPSEDDFNQEYAVYDFLDRQDNTVLLESGKELKPRTPHFMVGRVPAAIAMAELRPRFQVTGPAGESGKFTSLSDYDVYYGESLYRADRGMFNEQNFLYSVMAELAKRSIKQPLMVLSRDGSLTLKGDPRVSGQEISLSTANEEGILPIPPMEVVKEFGSFLGLVSGMMQRGSFNFANFGNLEFQLSSVAIGRLRENLMAPMQPHLKSVKNAYKQVLDILCEGYASGNFDAMTLHGRRQDTQKSYFQQEIPPELIKAGGNIEVNILPVMPQDDAGRVSLAQILRDPSAGGPLADDRFIREYLDFQDPDQMERAVWEQMANRGSPMAVAWNSYTAAKEQGDEDLTAIWWDEFVRTAMTAWLQTMQLTMMTGGQGAPGQPGEGGGKGAAPGAKASLPRPQNVPPQAMGIQGRPNPQAATRGGQMGAGQPRNVPPVVQAWSK